MTTRRQPNSSEVGAWRDATQALPYAADRVTDNLIDAWELRLVNCIARYRRLLELEAPEVLLRNELGMISRALAGVLAADDLDAFQLPSMASTR